MLNPRTQAFSWSWAGQPVSIAYEMFGTGPPCLLLPAFSTVSTREEVRPLGERLAGSHTVTLVDWPGFGESARQRIVYEPSLMHAFLGDFVTAQFDQPPAVIAAGHAAGYALSLARRRPGAVARIVLIAPTWRGPLPTAMRRPPPRWEWVRRLVRAPLIGPLLYRLNTAAPVIALMYREHVFADPSRVTRELVRGRQVIARAPRARFASVAFVSGGLDPAASRESFLELLAPAAPPARPPVLVVYGEDTPPRSRAEMEALQGLAGVELRLVPGALGLYEEHPDAVYEAVEPFLAGDVPTGRRRGY